MNEEINQIIGTVVMTIVLFLVCALLAPSSHAYTEVCIARVTTYPNGYSRLNVNQYVSQITSEELSEMLAGWRCTEVPDGIY